ncbi:MAG: 5'-nucleotidase C-terminal domain-containing protein [Gemmatimonadales bacterium]
MILPLLAVLLLPPADTVRVVVVATTDIHGYVTHWDYLQNSPWPGGLARAAAVVDSLRLRYPGQVVVVDAGDALQGSPLAAYFGREAPRDPHPVIDAMNLLGYDAATPGDHDFDFGLDLFNRSVGAMSFPFVSANLRALPSDTLLFARYVVVQRNGVRVAISGVTTPGTMVWHRDRFAHHLHVERIDAAAAGLVREMRKDADLTIILSHSGLDGPSSYDTTGVGPENATAAFATGADRPDIVVVGHSHGELVDSVLGGVHFVQPQQRAQSLAVLYVSLVLRGGRLVPVRVRGERISLQGVMPATRLVRRLDEPHRATLNWVAKVVGESPQRITLASARVEDTPLMRLVHAVQRRATRADLSAAPAFDLRAGIGPGEITVGQILQLYPLEHTLKAVKISGDQLRAALEQSARYFFVDSTGKVAPNRYVTGSNFDLIGGAGYTLDLSRPAGSRVTRLEVNGRPVAATDSFTLALSDFRQQGGGNFPMFANAPVVYDKGENIRDLIIAELERRRVVRLEDFAGSDWELAPPDYARRARALFVREAAPVPVSIDDRPLEPLPTSIIPVKPTRQELAAKDSAERVIQRRDSAANAPVAILRRPMSRGPAGTLGRLVADAYRAALRTDFAVAGGRDLEPALPAGPLTNAALAAAVPTEARLLTVRLTGAAIRALVENVLADSTPCCQVSGLLVEYDPRARAYDRVKRLRTTGGIEVDRKKSYLIALSTNLLDGDALPLAASDCRVGQGCRAPRSLEALDATRTEIRTVDALRDHLRRLPQPVVPTEDLRLVPRR